MAWATIPNNSSFRIFTKGRFAIQDAKNRAALLVRCSEEEAQIIRDAAKRERRTLSAFILHTVMSRINNAEENRHRLEQKMQRRKGAALVEANPYA
jgi:uncharacterized protein (DUF1778 family)